MLSSHWGDGATLVLVLVGLWCWGHCCQAGAAGTVIVVIMLVLVSGAIIVIALHQESYKGLRLSDAVCARWPDMSDNVDI